MGIPIFPVSQTPPANDLATAVVSGQFTGTGQSGRFEWWGPFNLVLYGASGPNGNWNATIRLERSFDGGTTWIVCGVGGTGTQAQWASAGTGADVSVVVAEPEMGVIYRLNCTAFVSGPVNYRMSGNSQAVRTMSVASVI